MGGVHVSDWVTTPLAAATTPQEGNLTTHTPSRRATVIAFAGAGAIALAAMSPAAEISGTAPGAAVPVALAAATDPIESFIVDVMTQVAISGAERVNDANTVPAADAPAHIAAGLVASAIRAGQGIALAPQQFAALVSAISSGDETTASAAIRDIIDGPLWSADPTLLSTWESTPAPIGGEGDYTGAVWTFREQWRNANLSFEDFILNALYPESSASGLAAAAATPDPLQAFIDDVKNQVSIGGAARVNTPVTVPAADAASHIAAGLAASAIRTVQGLVLAPQQIIKLATALSTGDKPGASAAIVDLIDGPLWSADPALLSVWEAAPKPIGGEGTPTGAVWQFRESWRTTGNSVEINVLDALNLPKPPKLEDTSNATNLRTVTLAVPAATAATQSDVKDDKDVSDPKAVTGTASEPTTKAEDTTRSSGRHRKSTFGSHRDSSTKTASAAKTANSTADKKADSGAGDKSSDK